MRCTHSPNAGLELRPHLEAPRSECVARPSGSAGPPTGSRREVAGGGPLEIAPRPPGAPSTPATSREGRIVVAGGFCLERASAPEAPSSPLYRSPSRAILRGRLPVGGYTDLRIARLLRVRGHGCGAQQPKVCEFGTCGGTLRPLATERFVRRRPHRAEPPRSAPCHDLFASKRPIPVSRSIA